jgi:hypothetical protein
MEQGPLKPRFSEICQQHNLDYHALQALAERAGVKKDVVDAMSMSVAVHRADALKILSTLSEHTGKSWTLDSVQVRLLPTFQDYHAFHHFDLALLSNMSGISFDRIDVMLRYAMQWRARCPMKVRWSSRCGGRSTLLLVHMLRKRSAKH